MRFLVFYIYTGEKEEKERRIGQESKRASLGSNSGAKLGINVLRGKTKNEIQLLGKDELPGPIRFFSVFHCRLVPRACVYKFMRNSIVLAHKILVRRCEE